MNFTVKSSIKLTINWTINSTINTLISLTMISKHIRCPSTSAKHHTAQQLLTAALPEPTNSSPLTAIFLVQCRKESAWRSSSLTVSRHQRKGFAKMWQLTVSSCLSVLVGHENLLKLAEVVTPLVITTVIGGILWPTILLVGWVPSSITHLSYSHHPLAMNLPVNSSIKLSINWTINSTINTVISLTMISKHIRCPSTSANHHAVKQVLTAASHEPTNSPNVDPCNIYIYVYVYLYR